METQKTFTHVIDSILIGKKDDVELVSTLKSAFGLGNLTYNDDFANQLAGGVGNWQSLNWDPEVSSDEFYRFCGNLTSKEILYPGTADLERTAARLIGEGGYDPKPALVNQMLNCTSRHGDNHDVCLLDIADHPFHSQTSAMST